MSKEDKALRPMELEQLNDWLWCLRTEIVQAYAIGERNGFNLIDTSTAGSEHTILSLSGDIAGTTPRRSDD